VESSSGNARPKGKTPPFRLGRRRFLVDEFSPVQLGLTQDKQVPSGAPNRRGNVEIRGA